MRISICIVSRNYVQVTCTRQDRTCQWSNLCFRTGAVKAILWIVKATLECFGEGEILIFFKWNAPVTFTKLHAAKSQHLRSWVLASNYLNRKGAEKLRKSENSPKDNKHNKPKQSKIAQLEQSAVQVWNKLLQGIKTKTLSWENNADCWPDALKGFAESNRNNREVSTKWKQFKADQNSIIYWCHKRSEARLRKK